MSEVTYFLDVNIPLYAAGREHPYKESCRWVLSAIAAGRITAAIDAEIVQEVLYCFGALDNWRVGTEMARALLDLMPLVLPVTADDAATAVALFGQYGSQGVKARDVLHAAVMQRHALTHIISTDTHFDLLPGITRVDPLRLFSGEIDL